MSPLIKRVSDHENNSDQSHQCSFSNRLGMFAKDDTFYHMVVLILTCSSNVGTGIAYIVRDSREDVIDSSRSLYFGKSPTFPDYFGKSEESDFSISDEFGSPEPFTELNNPHRYVKPHLSSSPEKNGSKTWKNGPSHGSNGRDDHRPGKRPILSLYDDWSPEDGEDRMRKPSGRPYYSSFKEGEESGQKPSDRYALPKPNVPGPPYTPIFSSTPEKLYKSAPNEFHSHPQYSPPLYKHNSDQPLLSQYYKNLRQPTPTTFSSYYDTSPQRFNKDIYVHGHQYGIHHDYTPPGKGDEGFSFRSVSSKPPIQNLQNKPEKSTFYDGGNSWTNFKPSSPDLFLNKYANFHDFKTDFVNSATNYNKKKIKRSINPTSCVKKIKTSQVGKNPVKWMSCLTCVDEITGERYEKCSDHTEQNAQETARKQSKFRGKRSVPVAGHHRYEFDPDEDYHYGPDHHEYRFGPEHFTDEDTPVENNREIVGEEPQETESCWKKKKGEMLCIMCENRSNGGTYEQCSYGSDPKKNSYESSVSKVYGTPRLPNERVKQSSEGTKHPAPNHPQNNREWHDTKGRFQNDNGNGHVGSNNRYNNGRVQSTVPERDRKNYRIGHKHIDVNKPNVFDGHNPYHNSGNSKPYTLPDPYKPEETFVDHEEPLRHQLREYRQSPFNDREPFEEGYADSSHEVFPKVYSNPFSPSDYPSEYDEYDDYASAGDIEDGQGQFTANLHKHVGNPSEYSGHKNRGDFIEKAIGDFSSKNRTSCTKIQKEKMTCYQCVDERGSKKEECIYVAGNKPKTKQLSFREVREFNYYPANNHTNGTERSTNHNPAGNQRLTMDHDKRKFKKYYPASGRNIAPNTHSPRQARSSVNSTPTSQVVYEDSVRSGSNRNSELVADAQTENNGNSSVQNVQSKSNYNPIPTDPPVFSQDVHYDVDHSDEIEMDFDPVLGLSLPRYMLEKSEHEAIFDEALASG